MKITTLFIAGMSLLLTLFTCAREVEDEEEAYREAHFGTKAVSREAAVADWSQFMSDAKIAFRLTERNIAQLNSLADKADLKTRDSICHAADIAESKLKTAKKTLAARDVAFKKELARYNQETAKRNDAFMKQFRRDLFDLNIDIEKRLDE